MADKFQKAVDIVNGLPKEGPVKPSDDDKLEFYGYFKQATIGDITTGKPLFDLVGRAKWNAWDARKGTSEEAAKSAYVAKLVAILETCDGDNEDVQGYLKELK